MENFWSITVSNPINVKIRKDFFMKKIKCAIIGTGGRCRSIMKELLKHAQGNLEVVSVYDPEQWMRDKFFNDLEIPAVENSASAEAAINAPGVEWVIVASPNSMHKDHIVMSFAAGKNVFELHGSVHRNFCLNCNSFYDASFILEQHKIDSEGIPHCTKCNHIVKPDVVLYEESLDNNTIDNSIKAISKADTLIIGGTSLVVYPASGLVRYFRGKNLVIINMSPTDYDKNSTLLIQGKIGEVLSRISVV